MHSTDPQLLNPRRFGEALLLRKDSLIVFDALTCIVFNRVTRNKKNEGNLYPKKKETSFSCLSSNQAPF